MQWLLLHHPKSNPHSHCLHHTHTHLHTPHRNRPATSHPSPCTTPKVPKLRPQQKVRSPITLISLHSHPSTMAPSPPPPPQSLPVLQVIQCQACHQSTLPSLPPWPLKCTIVSTQHVFLLPQLPALMHHRLTSLQLSSSVALPSSSSTSNPCQQDCPSKNASSNLSPPLSHLYLPFHSESFTCFSLPLLE